MPRERKVALVTGGAKRVGRAIVERLAEAGFEVVFTYHSTRPRTRRHRAVQVDLRDPEYSAQTLVKVLRDLGNRLDVLVNNASIYSPGDKRLREMMAVHVETPLWLCRVFGPMLRRSRGHVVNMVDLLAERPWPEYAAYCASKAALWNLTLSLARDLAPQVTVNGIAPGVVEWPEGYPKSEQAKYLKRVPLNRPGTPRDVANLVHFLVTEGSYLTGQIIRLDGGRSIT